MRNTIRLSKVCGRSNFDFGCGPWKVVLNRYYDPATDQFMSIDPDVATTNQPYLFTNDDPLNAEDPLGESAASRWIACLALALAANCFSQFGANEPKGGSGGDGVSSQDIRKTQVPSPKINVQRKPHGSSFLHDLGGVLLAPSRGLQWVVSHLPSPPRLHFPHIGPIPFPFPFPVPVFG
jgi:hypothetical protein